MPYGHLLTITPLDILWNVPELFFDELLKLEIKSPLTHCTPRIKVHFIPLHWRERGFSVFLKGKENDQLI